VPESSVSRIILVFVITVFMCANVAKAELIEDGLVGYWSLDANTTDGKNVEDVWDDNEGTITGDYKKAVGRVGDAMEFDGLTSVDIPGTDSLNFNGEDELTVAAWVNAGTDDPVVGVVVGCCGTIVAQRDVNGWALRYDGRNAGLEMEFIVCPGWQGDGGFGTSRLEVGEWHHLTGVVGDGKMFFYLDGELVNEMTFGGPISTAGTETEIGHANDGGFIGLIDEVVIYDRALSEEEVMQIYLAEGFAVDSKGKLAVCWGEIKK